MPEWAEERAVEIIGVAGGGEVDPNSLGRLRVDGEGVLLRPLGDDAERIKAAVGRRRAESTAAAWRTCSAPPATPTTRLYDRGGYNPAGKSGTVPGTVPYFLALRGVLVLRVFFFMCRAWRDDLGVVLWEP